MANVQKPDNPLAFPSVAFDGEGRIGQVDECGMTLRDWFAAKALSQADSMVEEWTTKSLLRFMGIDDSTTWDSEIHYPPALAKMSYAIANAMLVERAKTTGNE